MCRLDVIHLERQCARCGANFVTLNKKQRKALSKAKEEYKKWGIDTIPLIPNFPYPLFDRWEELNQLEMWIGAPEDANIGIRLGGQKRLAVIDFYMPGGGILFSCRNMFVTPVYQLSDFPIVGTTPYSDVTLLRRKLKRDFLKDGKDQLRFYHIYFSLKEDISPDFISYLIEKGFTEIRQHPDLYVGAPPSLVQQSFFQSDRYHMCFGNFKRIPELNLSELKSLMNLLWMVPSFSTQFFTATSKDGVAFMGKAPKEFSIEQCKNDIERVVNAFVQSAISSDWRLNTRKNEKAVFKAHAQKALEVGSLTYAIGFRELGQMASVSHVTASKMTKSLIQRGLLKEVSPYNKENLTPPTYTLLIPDEILAQLHEKPQNLGL